MNKDMINICLEEAVFDQEMFNYFEEAWGYKTAHNIGANIAVKPAEVDKFNKSVDATNAASAKLNQRRAGVARRQDSDEIDKFNTDRDTHEKGANKKKQQRQSINQRQEVGGKRGENVLTTAYVGGGLILLYKGIKSLYKKYKAAKTPEAKATIKSQISTKKAQIKKAKAKDKAKKG